MFYHGNKPEGVGSRTLVLYGLTLHTYLPPHYIFRHHYFAATIVKAMLHLSPATPSAKVRQGRPHQGRLWQ